MPNASPQSQNPQESPHNGESWLSVSKAAAALGISTKTLRKRIASGEVRSRRVILERGGAAFEVGLEGSKTKFQNDSKKFQTDDRNGSRIGSGLSVDPVGLEVGLEPSKPKFQTDSKPTPESSKPISISSDREAELKDEIRFLRGIVESDRRDMAELRAALRKALDNAPRQLMAAAPEPETQNALQAVLSVENALGEETPAAPQNRPQNAPESAETGVSYGDIADWLESALTK